MQDLRMTLDFDELKIVWKKVNSHTMQPKTDVYRYTSNKTLRDALWYDTRLVNDAAKDEDLFAVDIKDSDYHQVDIADVVATCTQLTAKQQEQLEQTLNKYTTLFSGKLGKYPHGQIHLDIDPNATPVHKGHYPVAQHHYNTFKRELEWLVEIGVLEPCGRSLWASPTFVIPKKDGRVRWVSDFRALNKVLRRKIYPLPKIGDILARRTGYAFFTKLDVSMQFCTIATPFGLYR